MASPMAILAFAATSGYSKCAKYKCPGDTVESVTCWSYYFELSSTTIKNCSMNGTNNMIPFGSESYRSQSEFFVFVGVIAFLYCLAALAVYMFFWGNYENDSRFALGDFIITAIWALFWFAASCAWANGVSMLKSATSRSTVQARLSSTCPQSTGATDCVTNSWDYASLHVSLIAGFACFGLWAANLWFVYKETQWFKARAGAPSASAAGGPGMAQDQYGPSSGQTGSYNLPSGPKPMPTNLY